MVFVGLLGEFCAQDVNAIITAEAINKVIKDFIFIIISKFTGKCVVADVKGK